MRFLDFKLSCIASRRANISSAIRSSSVQGNDLHVNSQMLIWAPFHKGLQLIVQLISIIVQWQIVY